MGSIRSGRCAPPQVTFMDVQSFRGILEKLGCDLRNVGRWYGWYLIYETYETTEQRSLTFLGLVAIHPCQLTSRNKWGVKSFGGKVWSGSAVCKIRTTILEPWVVSEQTWDKMRWRGCVITEYYIFAWLRLRVEWARFSPVLSPPSPTLGLNPQS